MEKLDLKDRKILYQLDCNSRQSSAQIGKKIGVNRDVVQYRIKKLHDHGFIQDFYTVIDSSKLGYQSFRFYFVFQYVTPKIQKEILYHFIKNKYTYFVGLIEGAYHLLVIICVKDIMEFYSFYQDTKKKYGYYFKEIHFCLYIQLYHYRLSFLVEKTNEKAKPLITGGHPKEKIDRIDIKILKIMASNARIPTIDIANKLGTTTMVVNYRIKKMMKTGVIQGFKTNIDVSKLGYQNFKVDIYLKDYNDIDQITAYITQNPNLFYVNKTVGHGDLEIEFYVKNAHDIHGIMEDLSNIFPGKIRFYTTYLILKYIKRQFMPEI